MIQCCLLHGVVAGCDKYRASGPYDKPHTLTSIVAVSASASPSANVMAVLRPTIAALSDCVGSSTFASAVAIAERRAGRARGRSHSTSIARWPSGLSGLKSCTHLWT